MDHEEIFVVHRCDNVLAEPLLASEEPSERDSPREETQTQPLLSLGESQSPLSSTRDMEIQENGPIRTMDQVIDEQECSQPQQSRNVRLILAFTLFAFAGRSLWSQSVLSTLVYLLRNNNPEAVGFITAVMGMSQLLASFPTGVLADNHRRDSFLKVSSIVGLIAVGVTFFAVWRESYQWLTLALAVWGTFWGIASTSLSALFADSIPQGSRSFYFTRRSILLKIGNMTGPIAALTLFAILGDKWTIRDCSIVMGVGQIVCLPGMFILCCLSDDQAILPHTDELSEALLTLPPPPAEPTLPTESVYDNRMEDEAIDDNATDSRTHSTLCSCCLPEHRVIPVLISLADVLSGLGSGMSIRYFPIFFFKNLKLSPVVVQVLYTVSPLGQAVLMHAGQVWSRRIGRCKMSVVFKWLGIQCMACMIVAYAVLDLPAYVVCILYVLRTSFMNATSALTKSVLMDAVPKSERAKWSALESVNMFSWSGSAALGGLLVGYKGIIFNFIVTAGIQFLATLPLVILFSRDATEGGGDFKPNGNEQGRNRDEEVVIDTNSSRRSS